MENTYHMYILCLRAGRLTILFFLGHSVFWPIRGFAMYLDTYIMRKQLWRNNAFNTPLSKLAKKFGRRLVISRFMTMYTHNWHNLFNSIQKLHLWTSVNDIKTFCQSYGDQRNMKGQSYVDHVY